LKLTPADAKVNGLCKDEKCSCGLKTCEKGEICHNNNPGYVITHLVSTLTKEVYPLMCTKYVDTTTTVENVYLDDEFFFPG